MNNPKRRVFILEDSLSELEYVTNALIKYYDVFAFSNTIDFYKSILKNDVDIFLVDIVLQNSNGYTICKKLRSIERFKFTPIVIITSLSSSIDVIKGLQLGVDQFVTKPYNIDILKMHIDRLLNLKNRFNIEEAIINEIDKPYCVFEVTSNRQDGLIVNCNLSLKTFVKGQSKNNETICKGSSINKLFNFNRSDWSLLTELPGDQNLILVKNNNILNLRRINGDFYSLIVNNKDAESNERVKFYHMVDEIINDSDKVVCLTKLLSALGCYFNVSRTYIFEDIDIGITTSNTFEWCNSGVDSHKDALQNIEYDTLPSFRSELLSSSKVIASSIYDLPDELIPILDMQGIKSIFIMPIIIDSQLVGFFGMDHCKKEHNWTKEEHEVMSFLSKRIALVLNLSHLKRNLDEKQYLLTKLVSKSPYKTFKINQQFEITYPYFNDSGLTVGEMLGCAWALEMKQCGTLEKCKYCSLYNYVHEFIGSNDDTKSKLISINANKDASKREYNTFHIKLIKLKEENSCENILMFAKDVSENVNCEMNKERLLHLLNNFDLGVILSNENGEIIFANEVLNTWLQYEESELLKLKLWNISSSLTRELWRGYWTEIEKNKIIKLESKQLTKDKESFQAKIVSKGVKIGNELLAASFISNLDLANEIFSPYDYKLIFDNLSDACVIGHVVVKDEIIERITIVEVNQSFKDLYGIGNSDEDYESLLIFGNDSETINQLILESNANNQVTSKYLHYSKVLNRYYNIVILFLPHGNFLISYRDVTDQQLKIKKIENINTRFKMAIKGANVGLWHYEFNNPNGLFINTVFAQLLGYNSKESLSPEIDKIIDKVHPEDRYLLSRIEYGGVEHGLTYVDIQIRIMDSKENYKWFKIFGSNSINDFDTISGVAIDINKTKILEESLEKSKSEYKLITDNIVDLVWKCDLNLGFTFLSPSVLNITGETVSEGLTKNLKDKLTLSSYKLVNEILNRKLNFFIENDPKANETEVFEIEYVKKDKETIWLQVTARILCDQNNEPYEIIGVARDISSQIEAQAAIMESKKQLQKNNYIKDRFISILGHDLYNMLGGTIQFMDIMSSTDLSEKEKNRICNIIVESNRSAIDLLKDLILFGKTSMGKVEFNPEYLKLSQLINKSISFYKSSIVKKEINLHVKIANDVTVYADSFMLKTITRNLINNAIKFSPKSSLISIYYSVDDEYSVITFEDNGVGMTDSQVQEIFSIDKYVNSTGTFGEKGFGLGLVMVKEFVEIHGGRILIKSKLQKGTSISIFLPIA